MTERIFEMFRTGRVSMLQTKSAAEIAAWLPLAETDHRRALEERTRARDLLEAAERDRRRLRDTGPSARPPVRGESVTALRKRERAATAEAWAAGEVLPALTYFGDLHRRIRGEGRAPTPDEAAALELYESGDGETRHYFWSCESYADPECCRLIAGASLYTWGYDRNLWRAPPEPPRTGHRLERESFVRAYRRAIVDAPSAPRDAWHLSNLLLREVFRDASQDAVIYAWSEESLPRMCDLARILVTVSLPTGVVCAITCETD